MLRVKLTKIKQICASAFIPRILQELKIVQNDNNISKYFIEYVAKARRSTDSGSKDKDFEERKRIIDKCFSEKTPVLEDNEQHATEPQAKDTIELHNAVTAERNKSFVSKILDKDERDNVRQNAQLQSIAAQVKEVKQAHDINPAENSYAETVADKSKTSAQVTENNDMSEDTVQIDTAAHLKSERIKEGVGTPKVSEFLQNINVQTTTENVSDVKKLTRNTNKHNEKNDKIPSLINVTSRVSEALESAELEANVKEEKEKLVQQIVHIDKTPHVDIETDRTDDINSTSRVAEELENADILATKAEIEQDKLTQDVIHIDKNPFVDVDIEKEKKDQNVQINKTPYVDITPDQDVELNTTKASETLGKAEVGVSTLKIREEKLSQHLVHVDKTPVINMAKEDILISDKNLSYIIDKSTVQATSAKVEEEKLTQKIDKVDETPHVEASVDKIEGFNTPPKILGHEATRTLSTSESSDTTDQPEQVNLEELAKKCLGKPDGEIDQILLKELKNISRANSIKFDLPKEESSQKYFSQIFENKSKDNNNIVFDITNANLKQVLHKGLEGLRHKENRVKKFDPFYLDTVPIVTPNTRDYNEDSQRNINPDSFKNILLDIPAVLDPYDMQAIPFHQYVSKENIILQELQVEPSPSKNIQETNAPMNEEVILRREDEEKPENNEIKELEEFDTKVTHKDSTAIANAVKSLSGANPLLKPTEIPALTESDVSKLLEYKHVLSAQQEALARMSPNIMRGQCPQAGTQYEKQSSTANGEMEVYNLENAMHAALTSTGAPTTPTDPFGNPTNMPTDQPKIEHDRQLDPPPSTAISANQDPSEYFPTQHLSFSGGFPGIPHIDYKVTDSSVTYTGVFDTKIAGGATTEDISNDNLISQSIYYYSIFPQLAEPEESSNYRKSDGNFITKVFVQPQEEDCSEDFIQKESKFRENLIQTERKREYLEHFVQPEPKVQDLQEEIVEPEPKCPNIGENTIQPAKPLEDIREISKQVEKVEASATKDIESIPISEEKVPLSVLLRRVRERNRLELIRSFKAETEMKNPCLPPLDKSKPKTKLQPKPCQPKPKEESKPPPCKPIEKKDPCAKFVPFFFGIMFSDVSVPPKVNYGRMSTYISLAKEMTFRKLKRLCQILGIINTNGVGDKLDVACARQFEPWVPIPSWPLPKTEKKRELVCPKDGCKLPVHPVRSNTDKPCLGMPKKISPKKT